MKENNRCGWMEHWFIPETQSSLGCAEVEVSGFTSLLWLHHNHLTHCQSHFQLVHDGARCYSKRPAEPNQTKNHQEYKQPYSTSNSQISHATFLLDNQNRNDFPLFLVFINLVIILKCYFFIENYSTHILSYVSSIIILLTHINIKIKMSNGKYSASHLL